MESKFKLPLAKNEDTPPEKHSNLMQIIVVISSGILSSSAIAAVLKAWLDNRKTTLTIQIDGDRKKLEYTGHHLDQDAPIIQNVLNRLSEETKVAPSVDAVTIDMKYGEKEEGYLLTSGSQQENIVREDGEQVAALPPPSLLKRLLPGRSRK